MIPGNINTDLISGADEVGYQVTRSLRFNSADSAFLSRTPASAGNRKTWTWAGWVKRGSLSGTQWLFECSTSATYYTIFALNSDAVYFYDQSNGAVTSTALYRDPGAWMHLVLAVDTTQATASDRVKMYVNGAQITALSGTAYPTQNADTGVNSATLHSIGARFDGSYSLGFNGYLADIHFIDGQALTPSSFAETNATTGQWVPKAYTGSYGTNGFRLDFSDNSAATATTLGKDRAGSNNWTPNNLSVTAGTGNDSLVDTPTSYGTDTGAGGEVGGNYATLTSLALGGGTLSNGNLDVAPAGFHATRNSTIKFANGKWYAEFNLTAANPCGLGITSRDTAYTTWPDNSAGNYWFYFDGGTRYFYPGGGTQSAVGGNPATGVWKIALDLDSRKCWIGAGSIWYDSAWGQTGNPATGANPTFSSLPTGDYYMFVETHTSASWSANFGQRPFAYTAPSGFKAVCDTNLPAPTIAKPSTVMDVKLYTGTGSTQTISGLGFSPDLVWGKVRSTTGDHHIVDSVRGDASGTTNKTLFPNTTDSEYSSLNRLYDFSSTGFTAGGVMSTNAATYVAWAWDAGTTTTTNTQGSITSQVRANPSAGFSIVTYTFNSSGTVGHGLGVAPDFIIVKARGLSTQWFVYHKALGTGKYIRLSFTGEAVTFADAWNPVNSTVFRMEAGLHSTGSSYVAYCFAPVAGYSAFGSYTGNGSTDGPFVYTGFRPRWILIKMADTLSTYPWEIYDTTRSTYNVMNVTLSPNTSTSEPGQPYPGLIDVTANGFKIRSANNTSYINYSAATYIYAAFAESPFQYARAR